MYMDKYESLRQLDLASCSNGHKMCVETVFSTSLEAINHGKFKFGVNSQLTRSMFSRNIIILNREKAGGTHEEEGEQRFLKMHHEGYFLHGCTHW